MKYQVRQSDLTLFIDSPISILDLFQKFHLFKTQHYEKRKWPNFWDGIMKLFEMALL